MDSFLYVSLGLIALGVFFLLRTIAFLRRAVATEGTVVDMHASSGEHGPTYAPIVEYRRPDGQTQRFQEEGSSSHPGVSVGDRVPVKFDPERPERAASTVRSGSGAYPRSSSCWARYSSSCRCDRARRTAAIGETGFEPATFRPPAGCATRLRHSPWAPPILDARRRLQSGQRAGVV